MFTVDVSEHLTDLLLRQAFRIKSARKTLTFILLVPKNSQYSRMEVSVPVPRNTEGQSTTHSVCPAWTITVTFGAAQTLLSEIFATF